MKNVNTSVLLLCDLSVRVLFLQARELQSKAIERQYGKNYDGILLIEIKLLVTFASVNMIRKITAFILIITLLTANFSRLFIYAGFAVNKKFIASTLCENRDKPQLHCNGKCYLMKKIKLAEEKEKNQERRSLSNTFQEAPLFSEFVLSSPVSDISRVSFPEPATKPISSSDFVFQPPRT